MKPEGYISKCKRLTGPGLRTMYRLIEKKRKGEGIEKEMKELGMRREPREKKIKEYEGYKRLTERAKKDAKLRKEIKELDRRHDCKWLKALMLK